MTALLQSQILNPLGGSVLTPVRAQASLWPFSSYRGTEEVLSRLRGTSSTELIHAMGNFSSAWENWENRRLR